MNQRYIKMWLELQHKPYKECKEMVVEPLQVIKIMLELSQ